eukprot:scaffold26255_cov106-Cyclotella_meneghiniana.AAC.3
MAVAAAAEEAAPSPHMASTTTKMVVGAGGATTATITAQPGVRFRGDRGSEAPGTAATPTRTPTPSSITSPTLAVSATTPEMGRTMVTVIGPPPPLWTILTTSPPRRHTYRNNNLNPTPTPPPTSWGGNNKCFGVFGEGEKSKEGDRKPGGEKDESVSTHGGSEAGSQGGNQINDRKRKGSSKKKGGKGNGKKTKESMEKIDEEVYTPAAAVEEASSSKKKNDTNKGKKVAEGDEGDDNGKDSPKKKGGKRKKLTINKFGQNLNLLVKLSISQEKAYSNIRYKISNGDMVTMDDLAEIEGPHNQLSLLVGAVNLRMYDMATCTKDPYHPDKAFALLRFVSKARLLAALNSKSGCEKLYRKARQFEGVSAFSRLRPELTPYLIREDMAEELSATEVDPEIARVAAKMFLNRLYMAEEARVEELVSAMSDKEIVRSVRASGGLPRDMYKRFNVAVTTCYRTDFSSFPITAHKSWDKCSQPELPPQDQEPQPIREVPMDRIPMVETFDDSTPHRRKEYGRGNNYSTNIFCFRMKLQFWRDTDLFKKGSSSHIATTFVNVIGKMQLEAEAANHHLTILPFEYDSGQPPLLPGTTAFGISYKVLEAYFGNVERVEEK